MNVTLHSIANTDILGRAAAGAFTASAASLLLLLEGELGSGKTTFTRFLVEALPGGTAAEVSSPSFTLCNIYPTRPEVWHYDLYRLESGTPADEILEALDYIAESLNDATAQMSMTTPVIMIVEWPERLDTAFLPPSYLHCRLTAEQNDRRASFTGYGKAALKALTLLQGALASSGIVKDTFHE